MKTAFPAGSTSAVIMANRILINTRKPVSAPVLIRIPYPARHNPTLTTTAAPTKNTILSGFSGKNKSVSRVNRTVTSLRVPSVVFVVYL